MPQAGGLRSGVMAVPGRGGPPAAADSQLRAVGAFGGRFYAVAFLSRLLILLPGASLSSLFFSLFYILYSAFQLKLLAFEPASSFRPPAPSLLLLLFGATEHEGSSMSFRG